MIQPTPKATPNHERLMTATTMTTTEPAVRYRFGFVLSTSLGNMTRYLNFRRFAQADPEVEMVWAPVKHFIGPGESDPLRWLPGPLRTRAIVLYQSAPVLSRWRQLDAVMIHLYEVDVLSALFGRLLGGPLRVISSDEVPAVDPTAPHIHPVDRHKPGWKKALRLRIDLWRVRRADLLVPFSPWVIDTLVGAAGVARERIHPIHVGLDLATWRFAAKSNRSPGERFKLLFVGGDFKLKGGPTLLEAFARVSDRAELHLVTKTAPTDLPAHVHVHADLGANDERLTQLYRDADVLVHPTTCDLLPWVVLEAMASGCPCVVTRVGGIRDLVSEGETGFFVPIGDSQALAAALTRLLDNPELRQRMGARARSVVEERYDAAINVPRILQLMKDAVDQRRSDQGTSGRRLTAAP